MSTPSPGTLDASAPRPFAVHTNPTTGVTLQEIDGNALPVAEATALLAALDFDPDLPDDDCGTHFLCADCLDGGSHGEYGDQCADCADRSARCWMCARLRGEPFELPPLLPLAPQESPPPARVTATPRAARKQLASLMQKEFRPIEWVVPGIIPEGVTLLVAPPKIGKSWLLLDIALAAATGTSALGELSVGAARPVLYCDMESGERRLQARVQAQGWTEFGSFEYVLDRDAALAEMDSFVERHRGERPLIVVDTLAAIQTDRPRDRSQFRHDYETLAVFQRFTRETPGAAVMIAHHTRKEASGDALDAVSGTNGLSGAVDTPVILSRPDRHSAEGSLHVFARDFEGGEFALSFEGCRWHIAGGGDAQAASERAAQIAQERSRSKLGPVKDGLLLVIESDPTHQWTMAEIAALYGGQSPESTLRRSVVELEAMGLIERSGRGMYRARSAT